MKKLAFCFLIYDEINREDLWNVFFKNIDPLLYSIYIHYKWNNPLKYFETYKLKNCIDTQLGDISLVKAQNLMIEEGLKDDNTHFIFLSNSCIPLKSFDFIYNFLQDYSYFNVCSQFKLFPKDYSFPFDNSLLENRFIRKAHQWCILNRKHAQLMVEKTYYLHWFDRVWATDEFCYITNIYANGMENEIITTPNLSNDATTFTNWGGMDYKYGHDGCVKMYSEISHEELSYLRNSKCLFGRKFMKECLF